MPLLRPSAGVAAHDRAGRVLPSTLIAPCVSASGQRTRCEDLLEVEGADVGPDDQQADDEAGVADAVGDERLVGGVGGAGPLVVEADQQVRADADQLPAHENLEQIVGQHQVEHREAEQRQEHEEPAKAAAAAADGRGRCGPGGPRPSAAARRPCSRSRRGG